MFVLVFQKAGAQRAGQMAHLTEKHNRKEDSIRKLRKITHNYPTSGFSGQLKGKQRAMAKGPVSVGDGELREGPCHPTWPKSAQGQTLSPQERTRSGYRMGWQGGAH